ncbi:hypothetical protein CFIMG_006494RA [Ceratocystis fimbriata CBS 114723]|uniref:Uncharacterized protein n=1 Tax=Ceratocystis fimbriata CBS 114723 TaxID=1035309 RepID=A0A2C5W082_9PEZI|nr:hypothetical protein CFIMG_006494RA [Ceratocystis fimbriata CBS 114723]
MEPSNNSRDASRPLGLMAVLAIKSPTSSISSSGSGCAGPMGIEDLLLFSLSRWPKSCIESLTRWTMALARVVRLDFCVEETVVVVVASRELTESLESPELAESTESMTAR